MSIRAQADVKFLRKYLFIGFCCVAFALYCLYDGIVLGPNKVPRTEAYAALLEEVDDKTERSQKWQEVCEENGWSYAIPEKTPEELQTYIQWQFWMAAGSFLVGIPMIIWFFRTKKTWVEADESSIQGSWGQEVQFKSIETLDKKKWKNKGIAKITYQQDGASKKFVLDDFKYQREPMGEIMKLIEASLNENQIVNGVTESPTKAGGESESGN